MIDGTYDIGVETALGYKKGKIVLKTDGSTVTADLEAPIIGKRRGTGIVEGNAFRAQGSASILLIGKIDFEIQGEVVGDVIDMDVHTSKGNLHVEGVRVGA